MDCTQISLTPPEWCSGPNPVAIHYKHVLPPTEPHSFYLVTQSTTILHNPKSRQKKQRRDNRTRLWIATDLQPVFNLANSNNMPVILIQSSWFQLNSIHCNNMDWTKDLHTQYCRQKQQFNQITCKHNCTAYEGWANDTRHNATPSDIRSQHSLYWIRTSWYNLDNPGTILNPGRRKCRGIIELEIGLQWLFHSVWNLTNPDTIFALLTQRHQAIHMLLKS